MNSRQPPRHQPSRSSSAASAVVPQACSLAPRLTTTLRPAIWIQYKKARSVALQKTPDTDRPRWTPKFLAKFQDDIKALGLELPGIQPDTVQIVWPSAQIRAVYTVQHRSSCDIVKHFFIRTFSLQQFKEACATLFIARVLYVEGGITIASDAPAIVSAITDNGAATATAPEVLEEPLQTSKIPVRRMPVDQGLPAVFHDVTNTANRQTSTADVLNFKDQTIHPPVQVHIQTPRGTTERINGAPRVPWWGTTHRQPFQASDMITPTPNACIHLRDPQNGAILTSQPVVRVLTIERADAGTMAFVTDGVTYADVAFSTVTSSQNLTMDLFVGAAVRLTAMARLNPPSTCPIRVDAFELVFDTEDNDGDSPPLMARTISNASSVAMITDGAEPSSATYDHFDVVHTLQAELEKERKRRQLLEQLLADVCRDIRLPPARMGGFEQSNIDAMLAISELGDLVAQV